MEGLELALDATVTTSARSRSVASFFVSRVDAAVDALLARRRPPSRHDRQRPGRGRLRALSTNGWRAIGPSRCFGAGAQVQRPLWASTSTKNPDYYDLLYVDTIVARRDGQHDARRHARRDARPRRLLVVDLARRRQHPRGGRALLDQPARRTSRWPTSPRNSKSTASRRSWRPTRSFSRPSRRRSNIARSRSLEVDVGR